MQRKEASGVQAAEILENLTNEQKVEDPRIVFGKGADAVEYWLEDGRVRFRKISPMPLAAASAQEAAPEPQFGPPSA